MKKSIAYFCTLIIITRCLQVSAQRTAICLTYDDGLPSHLNTVIPQLDSAGLKATFFLNAVQGAATTIGEPSPFVVGWKKAASAGHELANHTLFHPCPQQFGWNRLVAIEGYTVDRIVREVELQHALLAQLDSLPTKRAFAFPCNNTLAGKDDYTKAILKTGLISYCRGGGDTSSVIRNLKRINLDFVPSWLVGEGTSLRSLIAFAEEARKSGGMAIYQFHGIGAEFFTVSADIHRAFLRYLVEHSAEFEVLTFSEAMQRVSR